MSTTETRTGTTTGTTTETTAAGQSPPRLGAHRLLYVASGGLQAMFVPMWLQWLRTSYPDLAVRYVVTRSATRFTTRTSLAVAAGDAEGMVDEWPEQPESALHVDLALWPDAVLVHPATFDFVARLSAGFGDSPAMLALQCTTAPIVICPALPPNGFRNPAYRRNVSELAERENVTVLPPVRGRSMSTGHEGVGTVAHLPTAIASLEELREWVAGDA